MAETNIKITADTRQAEREIKKLESALEGINSVADGAATALAVITGAAAAMGFAILKTLDSAGQLIDASKALGVSVQSLQSLEHAAALAGVSADQLTGSLIRMSNNLGSGFAAGTGPAVDAMKKLGIPMREIMALRPDAQFARIADELNKMTNPAERNALAIDLLGKQGPRLLEVANNTANARKEMEALGLALSDIDVAALDMAGDSVDELTGLFDAGLKKAVAEISPYIVAIVTDIKHAIEAAGGFEVIWQNIKSAIKTALNIAIFTAAIFALGRMVAFALELAAAIRTAGVAMGLFNAVVMKNPLMLAVGAAFLLAKVLGIDVVGAIGDALVPTESLQTANEQIAEKAKEITKANEETLTVSTALNKEQQKALDALNDTITKLQQNAAYQRDILSVGEDEAKVRKAISEEAAKLEKVGLTLNDAQKERLRVAIEEEASIKRQIALRQEQSQSAFNAILGEQTALEQSLQKQLEFRLLMEGKGAEEIKKIREQKFREDPRVRKSAEDAVNNNVQRTINAEIGKYNQLFALQEKYDKDINALGDIRNRAAAGELTLTQQQDKALFDSQVMLAIQLKDEKLRIAQEMHEKLNQMELNRISSVMMAEKNAMAQAMSENDRATLQRIGSEERQRAIVDERIKFEKKSELEKAQFAVEQGANVFSALGAQNKKAFEAAKALNIANAIMNTYAGATKALATYPFPFGLIAAAGAVAAGMAQVAQIRSQSYSGRALGGPVMGGQTYLVGESGPELFTPQGTGSITRNGDLQGGGVTNVNFTIVANDTTGFDQLLASRKGVIQQIISDAMLEKGRRSMV